MPKGTALLVGLTEIDKISHGWDGKNGCCGCELDVDNVEKILKPLGFEVQIAKTKAATARKVLDSLRSHSEKLKDGDIFVFYFSGHGGQQPDDDPEKEELDGKDETLVLYDRDVIDDDLDTIWLSFPSGVRIVMLSDSCNSGSNYKGIRTINTQTPILPLKIETAKIMKAQLIHIGGCKDGGTSDGYCDGGVFTNALCKAWDKGSFNGSYEKFKDKVVSLISSGQKPQYNEYGSVTGEFINQKPFTIGG